MRKNLMILAACAFVAGCEGFGAPPGTMNDAGAMPVGDGGLVPRPRTDSGIEMPRETDGGPPLGDVPATGSACDPDRDRETYDCALEGCDRAYIVCLGDSRWRCVQDTGAICTGRLSPEDDAGVTETPDAGSPAAETDSGTRETGTDAGPPAVEPDAGPLDYCVPGSFVGCWLDCDVRWPGMIACNPATGRYDSHGGDCLPFDGLECPLGGVDAGPPAVDAGRDAGPAPVDAGPAPVDAGPPAVDAGPTTVDAGPPAVDAGPTTVMVTYEILFSVDTAVITRPIRTAQPFDLLEETAAEGAVHAIGVPITCLNGVGGAGSIETVSGRSYYRCDVSRPDTTRLAFRGRINFADGGNWCTVSGYDRTECTDLPGTTLIEPNTAGISWIIRRPGGASLLPPNGYPLAENYRHITEDEASTRVTDVVCSHMLTFSRP